MSSSEAITPLEVIAQNAPTRPEMYRVVGLMHVVKQFDNAGGQVPAIWRGLRCMCPDDCNCHHPHRTNYCGCQQHAEV